MVFIKPHWYGKNDGVTMVFPTGTTLQMDSGSTFSNAGTYSPTSVSTSGAIAAGTTLGCVGDFAVNTTKFVVTAATGATVTAGAVTIGTANNPIILSPAGTTSTPASGSVFVYFDGTDIKATNSAGKSQKLTAGSWA